MTNRQVASAVLAILLHLGAGNAADAETITLADALKRAESHPELALASADVEAARGRRTQAGTIAYNPELSGGLGPRLGGNQTMLDFEVGLSQTIELGGKRKHRRAASDARLAAALRREQHTRQLIALRVRYSFAVAVTAKRVLETTQEAEGVASELKTTSDERLKRGAGNLLEVNLAAAGVGRARRRRSEAEQALIKAEYGLASAVGAGAKTRLTASVDANAPKPMVPSIDELVRRALENRADLGALEQEREAAQASLRLAESLATPNLSLGGNYAHEEGSDQILATLSIELPLWNRNRGDLAEARANQNKAEVALNYAELELRRQVHTAAANYEAARKTVEAFDQDAVGKLADTLALTREAFERGKISILEFNLLRTEFVDVRLAYLDAVQEEVHARFELELAIGQGLGLGQ